MPWINSISFSQDFLAVDPVTKTHKSLDRKTTENDYSEIPVWAI